MKFFSQKTISCFIILSLSLSLIPWADFTNDAEAVFGLDSSYRQVKTEDSPVVYYLDHERGRKKAYVSAEAFLSYGNQWAEIKIVSQEELNRWPDIRLIKTEELPAVYYIKDKKKYLLSAEEFSSFGFLEKEIAVVSRADFLSYDLTDVLAIDYFPASGGVSGLRASLKSGSGGDFVPSGSFDNVLAIMEFSASEESAEITGLDLARGGVSPDGVIAGVKAEDESGEVLGFVSAPTGRQFFLPFNKKNLVVPAYGVKKVYLKVDFSSFNEPNYSLKLGVENSSAVRTASAGGLSGDFPLWSKEYRIANGYNALGALSVEHLPLVGAEATVKVGEKRRAITAFRFTETTGREDAILKKITVSNVGGTAYPQIANARLYDSSGRLVAEVASPERYIVFSIQDGYAIKKGRSEDFTLKIDVAGGLERGIKFVIDDAGAIIAAGVSSGYGLPVVAQGGFPVGSACGAGCDFAVIGHKAMFIASEKKKENDLKIYAGALAAEIGAFEIRNNIDNVVLENFEVEIISAAGAPALSGMIEVYDREKEALIATIDPAKAAGQAYKFNFGNYRAYSLGGDKDADIVFRAEIPYSAESGDYYQVIIKNASYLNTKSGEVFTDQAEILGQAYRLSKPAISLYAGKPGSKDYAASGDEKVKIGIFRLEASGDERVVVKNITIASVNGFKVPSYNNGFSRLALYKGNNRISEIIAKPINSSYTFSDLKLSVYPGKSVDINLRADVSPDAAGEIKMMIENISAAGYYSAAPAKVAAVNIESAPVVISKTAIKIEDAVAGEIVSGREDNRAVSFRVSNDSGETIKLKSALVAASGCANGLSQENGFSNLRFGYEKDGRLKKIGSAKAKPVAGTNEFSLGGLKIAPNESLVIGLYVDASASAPSCEMEINVYGFAADGYLSKVAAQVSGSAMVSSPILSVAAASAGSSDMAINSSADSPSERTASNVIDLNWPTYNHRINYSFNDPSYPFASIGSHDGIDINSPQGSKVRAAAAGIVSEVYRAGDDGYAQVTIEHEGGLSTVYGHLSEISVREGEAVRKGQEIGESGGEPGTPGAGAYSTGPHLHFEVRLYGTPVDPMGYVD